MSDEVKNQTNLAKRKGADAYHFRARIPAEHHRFTLTKNKNLYSGF
ncbi:hypothetical protein [Methylotenera sp. G11]|nr:hypothetical protein [Methylotenera sp. G11]